MLGQPEVAAAVFCVAFLARRCLSRKVPEIALQPLPPPPPPPFSLTEKLRATLVISLEYAMRCSLSASVAGKSSLPFHFLFPPGLSLRSRQVGYHG